MSKLYNGSICLSDIPKEKIVKSEKNGKLYLNINIWINDELDQFKNIGSLQIAQSKEERESKLPKIYFGNFKPVEQSMPIQAAESDLDDLPF